MVGCSLGAHAAGSALAAPTLGRPLARRPSAVRAVQQAGAVMTLSPPLEQAPPAVLDRPSDPPSRRTARIAGIFMVITFISIPALPLYDHVLHQTGFIAGGGGDLRVSLGAL